MNIILRVKIPSKLQWRRQGLGGQQANPMIDESKPKENKGRNKRKCKRSKITFAELLDKYQKKSEEKNAYRPNHEVTPKAQI